MRTIIKDTIKLPNGNKIKVDTGDAVHPVNVNIKRPHMTGGEFSQLVEALKEATQTLANHGLDMTIPQADTVTEAN